MSTEHSEPPAGNQDENVGDLIISVIYEFRSESDKAREHCEDEACRIYSRCADILSFQYRKFLHVIS